MFKRISYLMLVIAFVSMLVLAACSQDSADVNNPPPTTPAITDADKEGIVYIYELEKLARDVYQHFYTTWGSPVLNVISGSEQSHMDIMKELMDKYNLANPAAGKGSGEFSTSDLQQMYNALILSGSASEIDALLTAAEIEELDIIDIAEVVAKIDKFDIVSAFNKLTEGSENHLGIFTAKLKELGVEYQPQHISQQEFDRIIATVTTPTATSTPVIATFSELALKGKLSYNGNCFNCHGNSLSTGPSSVAILASYQNAQGLLARISTMPTRGQQDEWEVISYLLLEHNWVSGDAVFNKDTLSQILLTR
ncbi:MAG: DUF2202 domain-containing protein [Dehalogenimonas sp.]|uniref:DUF2202 domain-containing protein n=1 Tax=Candidatus Dehalogenimonas loeffleri TaxID=3127115 RepID=A0ABZ2J1G4_9CHLR|nr:DUF2202 domain-containing protein [Dehalogenimonas sp.]